MGQISVGHYEQDGGIIYLPLGYIPDYILLCDFHTSTNIIFYHWWRDMESHQAAAAQEGISVAEGVTARMADDAGIAAYDSGSDGPTVTDFATLVSDGTTPTAATSTAHGTYCKPSTSSTNEDGQTADRSAIFECVASTGACTTEPTWPVEIGAQVTDADSNTWERVNVALERTGYQGVCVQDNIQTDGQEMYYLAFQADDSMDFGDVVGWTGGVYGA